jgi:hypothetical protein
MGIMIFAPQIWGSKSECPLGISFSFLSIVMLSKNHI